MRLKEIDLTSETQGEIRLLVATPTEGSPWGAYEPLRGTSWEGGVGVVSGAALSHALHGYCDPLARELGRPAAANGKRIGDAEGACTLADSCVGWDTRFCRPGGVQGRHPGPPGCYEAPIMGASGIATRVCLAWKEGRHTVVVVGPEFSLT
jgi:hypothetical protein